MSSIEVQQRPGGENHRAFALISHGSGGSPSTHAHLAERLRGIGFEVSTPLHEGNHRKDNSLARSLENFERRPLKLVEELDASGARDAVLIGHSLGAYSALVVAGGVAEVMGRRIAMEPDRRVKALVLMAPSANWFAAEGALSRVSVPVLLLTGGADAITPAAHGDVVQRGIAGVEHRHFETANHYSFLSPFPVPDGVDRGPIFDAIAEFVGRGY